MRLVVFLLLFIFSLVVCVEDVDNDQSDVKSKYNFNHPPIADNNPIPVAIVYEGDVTVGKSSQPEVVQLQSNIEDISSTIVNQEEQATTEYNEITTTDQTDVELDDIPVKPKGRALGTRHQEISRDGGYQIPVAVVYDSVTDNVRTQQLSTNESKSSRRRLVQRNRRRKEKPINVQSAENDAIATKVAEDQSPTQKVNTTKPVSLKVGSAKRQRQRIDFVNLQTNRSNAVEHQPASTESTKPQPQRVNFVNLQTEKIEKPQPQNIESIKPQVHRVESETQKSLSSNIKPRSEERKRERDPVVRIVDSENYVFAHNGNFHYSYEGGDGTKAFSEGQLLKSGDNESAGEAVSGGFSYTDKEGNDFSLTYTADENGYRPVGAHLPTPPPIPPEIARALAYLATVTTPEPVTKPTTKT